MFQSPYNQVKYTMLGEVGTIQYFMVETKTGQIALKKSLMDDPNKKERYEVKSLFTKS